MPTAADIADAGLRHLQDGEALEAVARTQNADQLYGISAECSIKAVLGGGGIAFVPNWGIIRPLRLHTNELWPVAAALVTGLTSARYARPMLSGSEPFADWSVDDRYERSSSVDQATLDNHRRAARAMLEQTHLARLDGVL